MAIRLFSDKKIEVFFVSGRIHKKAGWTGVRKVVRRKLDLLHYASVLNDLRSPPANHLEALSGDLRGFYSIRINDQWRVVFRWSSEGAEDIHIVDYHG